MRYPRSTEDVRRSDFSRDDIPVENDEGQFEVISECRRCGSPVVIFAQWENGIMVEASSAACGCGCGSVPTNFLGFPEVDLIEKDEQK